MRRKHHYDIYVYVMGEIVQHKETDNYESATEIYFSTATYDSCYTELAIDGKICTLRKAEDYLDPDRSIRKQKALGKIFLSCSQDVYD